MKYAVFLLAFFFIVHPCLSQEEVDSTIVMDSASVTVDTLIDTMSYATEDEQEIIYKALPDTLSIEAKSFDGNVIERLKDDSSLNYKQPPTVAETLWDRFLNWIQYIIAKIFGNAVGTNWGRLITYILGLALLVVIIMMLLKVNAFRVLYSGEGATVNHQVLDENIHEMDFDKLIQDAVAQQDYKRAVRLVFLHALKHLSDRQLILWRPGKTNHDYVAELNETELKTGLNELSFYFDYAWYGNFAVKPETFEKVKNIFNDWKTKIR